METIKFTDTEQTYINDTFTIVNPHFAANPLNRDNPNDLREALRFREYNIGSIGVEGHKTSHAIFDKLGFCEDGKTTKNALREKLIADQKQAAIAINKEKHDLKDTVRKRIQELENLYAEIDAEDEKVESIKMEIHEETAQIAAEKLAVAKIDHRQQLIAKANDALNDMTVTDLRKMAEANKIKGFSTKRKQELIKLLSTEV